MTARASKRAPDVFSKSAAASSRKKSQNQSSSIVRLKKHTVIPHQTRLAACILTVTFIHAHCKLEERRERCTNPPARLLLLLPVVQLVPVYVQICTKVSFLFQLPCIDQLSSKPLHAGIRSSFLLQTVLHRLRRYPMYTHAQKLYLPTNTNVFQLVELDLGWCKTSDVMKQSQHDA